jgi:signal transduction histidine kinase/CheY-like chemotaxis protein
MSTFLNLNIRWKLITIVMTSCMTALLLAAAPSAWLQSRLYESMAREQLRTIARIVAAHTSAPLTFADERAARETLSVLSVDPSILAGRIYDRNDAVFAEYRPEGRGPRLDSPLRPDGVYPGDDCLDGFVGVILAGERLGTIWVRMDLRQFRAQMRQMALTILGLILLSAMAAFGLSSRLQTLISGPVLDLAHTAAAVGAAGYGVRARKFASDEIGLLADQFNQMMDQIEDRDRQLQTARDQLEDRVRQRTLELENEVAEHRGVEVDLRAAKTAAEESSRAKTAFLATMSHELRTPLNAVIGYSEMLEEDARLRGQQAMVEDLAKIRNAGRHLLSLINDILDLSKIEADKMQVHPVRTSIMPLVAEVIETVRPMAVSRNNQLLLDTRNAPEHLFVDPVRFRQILLNLAGNACKFTENGQVVLNWSRAREQGQDWVLCHVRDTGIGIRPDRQPELFRSFSQVDSSESRKFGGTGLGLAISQRLCKLMGGHVSVYSQPGQGSVFTIHMPASAGLAGERELPKDSQPGRGPDDGKSARILVVEDNETNLDVVCRKLQRHGYITLAARNGVEGVDLAARHLPDLILMDLSLPLLDGCQATCRLKQDILTKHIPVIMLTAHAMADHRETARRAGVDEFETKPTDYNRLLGKIQACLRAREGRDGKSE